MGIEWILDNPTVYQYYLDNCKFPEESELDNILSSNPRVSIVISARNEGTKNENIESSNLYQTLVQLSMQKGTLHNKLNVEDYEVIVVDNNSDDNTWEIINAAKSDFRFKIIPVYEERVGIRFAKKTAFDTAFSRQIIRKMKLNSHGLIATTDADIKEIDDEWISKIITLSHTGMMGCFGGNYLFDRETEKELPNATRILYEQLPIYHEFWKIFGRQTAGANSGIDPETYALVGGYTQPFNHGGDLHIGTKTILQGKMSYDLDSWVRADGRRLRKDPRLFVQGRGYSQGLEIKYDSQGKDIPDAEVEISRLSRYLETLRTHFFLQSALKPNVVFNPTNEPYFEKQLGGAREFLRFKQYLSSTISHKSPHGIAIFLFQNYLHSVFEQNKNHENYRHLTVP